MTDYNTPSKSRVLVVDDSAVIRSVITRILQTDPMIDIVGSALNGEVAVQSIKRLDPDIVVLDIEMPVMDGITALPLILKEKPSVKVLICSTLSARGADISVRALSLGAADCLLKPGAGDVVTSEDFQRDLLALVRSLTPRSRVIPQQAAIKPQEYILRPPSRRMRPDIVAIGSSTGGPRALMDMLVHLKNLPIPIVITQHMPATFTAMLAKHIEEKTGIPSREGEDGMEIKAGCAYVAPGGRHMTFYKEGGRVFVRLDDGPMENYCRPSVNPMLRSLIPIYNDRILTVILTGMGHDGSQACADIVASGGQVIAQDEASSVVWGMPKAVALAGLCSAILPLDQMHTAVLSAVQRK